MRANVKIYINNNLERETHNLIVEAGKKVVVQRIKGASPAEFTYIALGSGTTPPSPTDTALQTELTTDGLQRAVASSITWDTNFKITYTHTFTYTGTTAQNVSETGIFNASTGGNMLARAVFSTVSLNTNDTIKIVWDISVA